VAESRDEVDADESSNLYLTPAFWRRYGPDLANYGIAIAVDLHRGHADLPAFTAGVQHRLGSQATIDASESVDEGNVTLGVQRAIALETTALVAFAMLAGLAGLLLVGQTLGRQVFLESAEYPTLRALGMTRGQLVGVALARAPLSVRAVRPSPWPSRWRCRRSPRSEWPAGPNCTRGSWPIGRCSPPAAWRSSRSWRRAFPCPPGMPGVPKATP
jgi:hypothetical protein